MKGKSVHESAVDDHTYRIFPNDLNSYGTVFGGRIMGILDRLALVVAERHSGNTCVTAAVDAIHFLAPAGRGDNLIFRACVNRAWNTSMEIGVRVEAQDGRGGTSNHIVSAYFTFVALDKNQKPTPVPPLLAKSADEKRRYKEAEMRRKSRMSHKESIQESRG